ncbi:MAG: hypothetical protein ABJP48_07440 [Erythrobacter sp.]
MIGWEVVVIVAIIVWGVTQVGKAKAGIITDEAGNESLAAPRDTAPDKETQLELRELRERVKVLERIATDGNSPKAQDAARIAAEIEQLRDPSKSQDQA